jgi:hypothetical protein
LEELGVDGKIILKFVLKKQGGTIWTAFIWPGIEYVGRLF